MSRGDAKWFLKRFEKPCFALLRKPYFSLFSKLYYLRPKLELILGIIVSAKNINLDFPYPISSYNIEKNNAKKDSSARLLRVLFPSKAA